MENKDTKDRLSTKKFFIYVGNFQVPPEKVTSTQSTNSYPKSHFDLSPYYINLKIGSIPSPSPRRYKL